MEGWELSHTVEVFRRDLPLGDIKTDNDAERCLRTVIRGVQLRKHGSMFKEEFPFNKRIPYIDVYYNNEGVVERAVLHHTEKIDPRPIWINEELPC